MLWCWRATEVSRYAESHCLLCHVCTSHRAIGRGEPVPPSASLIFEVQLVTFEPANKTAERIAAPLTQRFTFAAARKAEANEAFNADLLPKAMVLYTQVRTHTLPYTAQRKHIEFRAQFAHASCAQQSQRLSCAYIVVCVRCNVDSSVCYGCEPTCACCVHESTGGYLRMPDTRERRVLTILSVLR